MDQHIILKISTVMVLSLAMPLALANDRYLQCQSNGSAKFRCSAADAVLVEPQGLHLEVTIRYAFDCQGHALGLTFASDSQAEPVKSSGSLSSTIRLEGHGPFVFRDNDPAKTYRATLVGDCELVIQALEARPSMLQLRSWKDEATSLARIIETELTDLRLLRRLTDVIAWDDAQLSASLTNLTDLIRERLPADLPYEDLVYPIPCSEAALCGKLKRADDMPPAWHVVIKDHPELIELIALHAQIGSVKVGRPAYRPDDTAIISKQLSNDMATASALIAQAEGWERAMDEDLRQIIERLKHLS